MAINNEKIVGQVVHYYPKINVAIVELSNGLEIGDNIRIEGATTNLQQTVESMQIEHKDIKKARKGDSIGLKVVNRCRKGDSVYKVG
jgi:putative protease